MYPFLHLPLWSEQGWRFSEAWDLFLYDWREERWQTLLNTYKRLSIGKIRIGSPKGGGKSDRQTNVDVHNTLPAFLFGVVLYLLKDDEMRCNQFARNCYYTQALSLALLIYYLLLISTITLWWNQSLERYNNLPQVPQLGSREARTWIQVCLSAP